MRKKGSAKTVPQILTFGAERWHRFCDPAQTRCKPDSSTFKLAMAIMIRKGPSRLRWHIFLICMGVLIVASETWGFSGWVLLIQKIVRNEGSLGYLLFVILYAVSSLALIPGTGMTVLAGILFSPVVAVALSSTGALLAAICAFLFARTFARKRVDAWLRGNEKYEKYNIYMEAHETRVLIIVRLIPVLPHVVLNYAFGLSRISFLQYVFWSWLCLLPGTAGYVLIAHVISANLLAGNVFPALGLSLILISVIIYFAW